MRGAAGAISTAAMGKGTETFWGKIQLFWRSIDSYQSGWDPALVFSPQVYKFIWDNLFLLLLFLCMFISRTLVYLHILTRIFDFMMIFADFFCKFKRNGESEKVKLIIRNHCYCKKSQQTKPNQPLLFLLQQGSKIQQRLKIDSAENFTDSYR